MIALIVGDEAVLLGYGLALRLPNAEIGEGPGNKDDGRPGALFAVGELDAVHPQVPQRRGVIGACLPGEAPTEDHATFSARPHRAGVRCEDLPILGHFQGACGRPTDYIVVHRHCGRRGARLKAGLPEPEFAELSGAFVVTFRQSRLTREYLAGLGHSMRQIAAVKYLQAHGRITNRDYVALTHVARPTATRDPTNPVARGLVRQHGRAGQLLYAVMST
jgi:hypothetical protein